MYFAQKLKSLREENHYLQRQIAALLDIDTPMYSRIERGERFAKEEHIPILAKYYDIDENELRQLWLPDKVADLVSRFRQDFDYYKSERYNETLLRSDFLDPLFELLGWDIKNVQGKSTNEREVLLEEPLKANAHTNTKKPDYTFRLFSERKFFLEAKKPHVKIDVEDSPARQVRRYGYTAGLNISVLSNFEYLYIYDTTIPVSGDDSRKKGLVKSYHNTE